MADNGAADPGNNNNNETVAPEGTIIKVTVKTPKDKEEIAISEDASVTQVCIGVRVSRPRRSARGYAVMLTLPTLA
jgi:hypothetical protein